MVSSDAAFGCRRVAEGRIGGLVGGGYPEQSRRTLTDQRLGLTQPGDDLLGAVGLAWHDVLPS